MYVYTCMYIYMLYTQYMCIYTYIGDLLIEFCCFDECTRNLRVSHIHTLSCTLLNICFLYYMVYNSNYILNMIMANNFVISNMHI